MFTFGQHRSDNKPRPRSSQRQASSGVGKVRILWGRVQDSLWFLPSVFVCAATLLGALLVEYDVSSDRHLATRWPRLFGVGVDGSRAILSALATSMIGVSGIAFSVTVVALSLASSQYTSRVLRNFMRDRGNQTVLGVFLGVFAYCLVVLRTIRSGADGNFVPSVAVVTAIALAFVALGFFIYFIHHISDSIQAEAIVERIARETLCSIDRLYPDPVAPPSLDKAPATSATQWSEVAANCSGYLQGLDLEALARLAQDHEFQVRIECSVGEFVTEDDRLLRVNAPEVLAGVADELRGAFIIGRQRTGEQDVGFGIRQLVDIALKALSPGINDSTTAVNCVNYLGVVMRRLAKRDLRFSPAAADPLSLRLWAPAPTYESLLDLAFTQIRQHAQGNVAVLLRLVEVLSALARTAVPGSRSMHLEQHMDLVVSTAAQSIPNQRDRMALEIQAQAASYQARHDRQPALPAQARTQGTLSRPSEN